MDRWTMIALAAATLAAGALAVAWPEPTTTHAGDVHITVIGVHEIWNGTVSTDAATPLGALRAAGTAGNFNVVVEDHRGFGECGAYVAEVDGLQERRDGTGWQYHVLVDGAWTWGDVGAACWDLSAGDAVRWQWIP